MANFVKGVNEVSIGDVDEFFVPEFALHTENSGSERKQWIVDSGCSKHMSHVKSDFSNYKDFKTPLDVHLADESVVKAVGFGTVRIYLSEEEGEMFQSRLKKFSSYHSCKVG